MARKEARVSADVWDSDPDWTNLTMGAQWAYMFLLSQRDLAHDGVIPYRVRRWAKAAKAVTAKALTGYLAELAAARFLVIDEDAEELLIRSLIRRDNIYRQPNVLRAAADHLQLVASPTIRLALAVELLRLADEPMPEGSRTIVAEMCANLPDPSADPSRKGSADPSRGSPGERGMVTVVGNGFPEPLSPNPAPPSSSPRALTRDPRPTRIPDDFAATPEMVAWAKVKTPDVDGRRQTERFIDYWRGKGGVAGTKVDWVATWRNWMRRAQDDQAHANGHKPSTTDQRVAAGLALVAELEAQQPKELNP